MLRHTETVLFFIATVAALALPAVPALQEWRADQTRSGQATLPIVNLQKVVITPTPHPFPEQVAVVH